MLVIAAPRTGSRKERPVGPDSSSTFNSETEAPAISNEVAYSPTQARFTVMPAEARAAWTERNKI